MLPSPTALGRPIAFLLIVLLLATANGMALGSVEDNLKAMLGDVEPFSVPEDFSEPSDIDYAKLGDRVFNCQNWPCYQIDQSEMPNANNTQSGYVWSQLDNAYFYCATDAVNTVCVQLKEGDLPYDDYITHSASGWAKCQYETMWSKTKGEETQILDCRTMVIKDRLRYEPRKSDEQANAFRFASGVSLYCNGTEISSCQELKLEEVPITREIWIPSWANSITHMSGYCEEISPFKFNQQQQCQTWIKMPEVPRVTNEFRDDTGSIVPFHPGDKVLSNNTLDNYTSVGNNTWANQIPVNSTSANNTFANEVLENIWPVNHTSSPGNHTLGNQILLNNTSANATLAKHLPENNGTAVLFHPGPGNSSTVNNILLGNYTSKGNFTLGIQMPVNNTSANNTFANNLPKNNGTAFPFHPGNKVLGTNSTINHTSTANYTPLGNHTSIVPYLGSKTSYSFGTGSLIPSATSFPGINTTTTSSESPKTTSIIPYLSAPENTTTTTMETTKTILVAEISPSANLTLPLLAYPTTTSQQTYPQYRPINHHSNITRHFNLSNTLMAGSLLAGTRTSVPAESVTSAVIGGEVPTATWTTNIRVETIGR